MQPGPLGGSQLRVPGIVSGPQPRQSGQHPLHRRPRPPHPRERGLRHRAGIHQQQRHPDLLRGPGGRDRSPGGRRDGHLPAALLPLHHRRGAGQQLRRQRHLRFRPDRAPDPRGHPEGKRRRRADVHHRPDHEPGPGPTGAGPRLRERALLLGGGSRQRARHARRGHPRARSHGRPGHLPAHRGSGLPLPGRPGQQRGQSQPRRDHGLGKPRRHPVAAARRCAGSC